MKSLALGLVFALYAMLAYGAETLDWAYPIAPNTPPSKDPTPKHVPGSGQAYTQAQIDDGFNPPDWYPDEHAPMPQAVARGDGKAVRGCALCHLPNGAGHPDSASLAGLSVPYMMREMEAFKNGERKGVRTAAMIAFAKVISPEDTRAASEYYAALKPIAWTKVVETKTVPKSFVGPGNMRLPQADGATEPIGHRIIELPQNVELALDRDAHSGFVAYVPPGSITKGKRLVSGAGGKTIACAICHGPELKGLGGLPPLAGRSPISIVRQLNDIRTSNRSGGQVELMKQVVAKLDIDDMIALAAYLGSLKP